MIELRGRRDDDEDILISINAREWRDPWEPRPVPRRWDFWIVVVFAAAAAIFFVLEISSAL